MTNDANLEEQYVKQIVSMGYTEENAKDYIKAQKGTDETEIDPNLGLENKKEVEVKLPEINESVFASSTSKILLPSEREVNPYARGLAVLLLIGCLAGFLNGVDYLSPTSGIIRPHELIMAQSEGAPEKSSIFLGTVELEDGTLAKNYTIIVKPNNKGLDQHSTTDSEGKFRIENLTPGLNILHIAMINDDTQYWIKHRILLNPPAGFEPYGFTQIDFIFPGKNEFGTDNGTGVFFKDYTPEEVDFPLIDPSAATYYSIVGYGFVGIALIGSLLSILAINTGNLGLIRSASGLVFFSMGPLYSSCCIGLIVFLLSFMIPNNEGF